MMANNTKSRHEEIYAAACSALEQVGGVAKIDNLQELERLVALRSLYKQVSTVTNCHIDTAKQNVAKALRRARFEDKLFDAWGGNRPGAGRPKNAS